MSIIITLINNTIVFISHNAICFGCFTPMSHGVNKKSLPVVSPPPLPLVRFSPDFFVALTVIFYQDFFYNAFIDLYNNCCGEFGEQLAKNSLM